MLFSGSVWFSTIDLKSGFWQIAMSEKDQPKTSFSIQGSGLWQFRAMPYGLCCAPATFERLMERILSGLTWQICLVYLDDIVVYSKTFTEHIENLETVFARLWEANLMLNPEKCNLFQKNVCFLGHVISESGIATGKVVGGFGKKSCVSTGVRKPGNTYASPTAMI